MILVDDIKPTLAFVIFVFAVFLFFQDFNCTTKELVSVNTEINGTVTESVEKETSTIIVGEIKEKQKCVSDEEFELLVRVCMSEAGQENFQGKVAVVETILNRVDMDYGSISEVVYEAYSTADNGKPNEDCYKAVETALKENTYPDNMIYFRTGHYHSFGTPYQKIGNHYFSLEE